MQTTIKTNNNPSLLSNAVFNALPKVRSARLLEQAVISFIGEAGWQALDTLAAGLRTQYAALLKDPAWMSGQLPTINITHLPHVGNTVSVILPEVDAVPVGTVSYQWKRAGSAISGATLQSYLLASADIASAITCTVTVNNGGNNLVTTTAATDAVAA